MNYPPIDDSWYHRLPGVPEETSAGGIVVRRQNDQLYVARVRERGAAHYVLPKGRLDPGESIEQAARREIAEETGLTQLHLLADLGMRERLSLTKRNWKRVHYFLFATQQLQSDPHALEAGNELVWVSLDQRPHLYWPEQKALLDFQRQQIYRLMQQET